MVDGLGKLNYQIYMVKLRNLKYLSINRQLLGPTIVEGKPRNQKIWSI